MSPSRAVIKTLFPCWLPYMPFFVSPFSMHSVDLTASCRQDLRTPFVQSCIAFSLVEVVLALGITGTALLVIFSVVPLGLSSLQDTQRQLVETEIYNKIGSELSTTSLYGDSAKTTNQLASYCVSNRFPAYFDAEGNELSSGSTVPPVQAVFAVRCTPGQPTATIWNRTASGELLYGTVSIYFQDPRMTAATPSPKIRQRTFLLSNHGS